MLGRFEQKPTKRTKGELPSLFASFPSVELRQFISLMGVDFFSCVSRLRGAEAASAAQALGSR